MLQDSLPSHLTIRWQLSSACHESALLISRSRETPLPSLSQLEEVFDGLPDEMQGPTRRVGPQYQKPRPTKPSPSPQASSNILPSWLRFGASSTPKAGNAMGALRNGDRGLIVAVNDSGNTGWVRFGRTGFEAFPMV